MSLDLDKTTWKHVAFGEVAKASKEKWDQDCDRVERYIAGEHMDTDGLKIRRWGAVGDGYLGPAFHRRFRPGQVLYGSRRTYLRKVAVAEFDGVCANTTFVVESKNADTLLPEFLPFVMTSEPFHAFAIAESKGSVNPYVNWSDIASFEFDLPPLGEQQRIADLLWSIERERISRVALHEALVVTREFVANAATERLVAANSVGFADLWSKSPDSGWSAAPVDRATGRFVLSLAALGPGGYRAGALKNVPDTAEVQNAVLATGDFLISRANTVETVGRVGIFDEVRDDVSFPDTMMRLHLVDEVLPRFAEAVLSSGYGRAHMRRTAAGSATSMVKINRRSLGSMRFPIASGDEQRALLADLAAFVRAREGVERSIARLLGLRSAVSTAVFGGAE